MRTGLFALVAIGACSKPHAITDAALDDVVIADTVVDTSHDAHADAAAAGFRWQMAGALVLWNDPLSTTAAQLRADHFSYVGQYAMNGCANNNTPYSCANNGCNYPGNPLSSEIAPSYSALASWITSYQQQGLYAGVWAVTYNAPEAEAHCMAEIANTLHASGATLDFFIVDAEKSYETHKADGYTKRFVDTFDGAITFSVAKAEAPECHIDIDFPYWANHGFAIQSQAYWNAYGVNPKYCLDWVTAYGVPKSQNTVMLDGYTSGPHTYAEYATDIANAHGVGFSIWRTISASGWNAWKPLIEATHIAEYP